MIILGFATHDILGQNISKTSILAGETYFANLIVMPEILEESVEDNYILEYVSKVDL